ncbi:MAG: MFS transporter [Haloarculaceae archaeon]
MTERTRTNPWLVLAGCFILSVGVNAYMIAPSSISPLFVERFGISTAAAGNIISAAVLGSILTQIPGGYLMDRFDNRWLVVPAVVGFLGIVAWNQVQESFTLFLLARGLAGVLGGFVFTAGANVVGRVFGPENRGVATGIYMTSPPASFALAHTTSPLVGTAFGPLRVFVLHGALAVLGVALFWVAAREPVRGDSAPSPAEFARALGNRSVILVAFSAFAVYALYLFLNTWIPAYGRDVLSLSLSAAGIVTAVVPVVGLAARPAGGWLSTRIGYRRKPVLAGGLLVGLVFLVAVPLVEGLALFLLALVLAAFTLQLGTGVYYLLTRELATPGTEGTSLTVMTTVSFTGSFVAPVAGGWLVADYSWGVAFAAFAAVGFLGAVVLYPVSEPAALD